MNRKIVSFVRDILIPNLPEFIEVEATLGSRRSRWVEAMLKLWPERPATRNHKTNLPLVPPSPIPAIVGMLCEHFTQAACPYYKLYTMVTAIARTKLYAVSADTPLPN